MLTGVNALSLNATTKAIEVARTRQRLDQTNDILANQTTINSCLAKRQPRQLPSSLAPPR